MQRKIKQTASLILMLAMLFTVGYEKTVKDNILPGGKHQTIH
jgi:hypothetical protein